MEIQQLILPESQIQSENLYHTHRFHPIQGLPLRRRSSMAETSSKPTRKITKESQIKKQTSVSYNYLLSNSAGKEKVPLQMFLLGLT